MAVAVPPYLPWLIAVPLIVWRMYGRIKRNIGRQVLGKRRPWVTLTLFPLFVILIGMGAVARHHPEHLWSIAAGLILGAALGVFGTKHTKFEHTPDGMFYTPNAHLGIALSVLLIGRIGYRFFQIYSMDPGAQPNPADFSSSPLTLGIFGLLAGYYILYAVGLIRYRHRVERELPQTPSPPTSSPSPPTDGA
jgi:hypothetical protein